MSDTRMENIPGDMELAIESSFAELMKMRDEMGGIYGVVTELTKNHELVQKVEQLKCDRDKIGILQPFFHWTPTSSTQHDFQKSSAKSRTCEVEGKALALSCGNDGERNRAVALANMIMAFADSVHDVARGHYIRAQILVCLEKQESSIFLLEDELEEALNILKENPHPILKHLILKVQRELITFLNSEFALRLLIQLSKTNRGRAEFTKTLFSLKSPNKKAPALEDFVEIRYDSSRGRHVVATKDVPVGTTLLVEKPFLSGLVDVLKLEIRFCHHCTKHRFQPFSCPNCVFVLFCSEKCRKEAESYHKLECPCFPDLHDLLSGGDDNNKSQWLMAFKLVCSLGPLELYRQFQKENEAKDSVADGSEFIRGYDPSTGIFDPSSFHTVRHIQRLNQPFAFQNLIVALALTKVIETRTNFFQFKVDGQIDLDPETKLQFKNYISEILFRQFDSTIFYAHNSNGSFQAAISPTVVLFSHSCDPNVIPCTSFHGDGLRIAKVAARDLKAGEELCMSYTGPFYSTSKSERHEALTARHPFQCDCIACSNFWPVMTEEVKAFRNVNPIFCCVNPSCTKSKSTNDKKAPLVSQRGKELKCSVCSTVYEEEKLWREFVKHLNTLERAWNLVEKNEAQKALEDVLAASTYFQENFQPPSVYQIKCQEILEKVMSNSYIDLVDEKI